MYSQLIQFVRNASSLTLYRYYELCQIKGELMREVKRKRASLPSPEAHFVKMETEISTCDTSHFIHIAVLFDLFLSAVKHPICIPRYWLGIETFDSVHLLQTMCTLQSANLAFSPIDLNRAIGTRIISFRLYWISRLKLWQLMSVLENLVYFLLLIDLRF